MTVARTHIAVLPLDVLASLSLQLDEEEKSNAGRFLTLPHPRTGIPSFFLHAHAHANRSSQIVEVQTVSPHAPRSWFLCQTEVVEDGRLVLMTPVDPAFLLYPIMEAAFSSKAPANFRTIDDIFESAAAKFIEVAADDSEAISEQDIHSFSLLPCVQDSMRRISEFKEVTPEITVFRLSHDKYMAYLVKKATRLGNSNVLMKCETLVRGLAKNELMDDGKEELLKIGRLKTACETMSQYLAPDIYKELLSKFDFSALEAHVENLEKANLALTIHESNTGKDTKPPPKQDIDASKKRKAAAQASKGVEKLKKVNTRGMAKLSTFFQKAGAK